RARRRGRRPRADPLRPGRRHGGRGDAAVNGNPGVGRTVLIADDHAAARAGVRTALEHGGFVVCAEASDGPGAVDAALRERPDACLLDVHMPGGCGIEAAAEIAARLPGTAIAMLTVSADEEDLFAAIQAGAVGYLLKDVD